MGVKCKFPKGSFEKHVIDKNKELELILNCFIINVVKRNLPFFISRFFFLPAEISIKNITDFWLAVAFRIYNSIPLFENKMRILVLIVSRNARRGKKLKNK